MSDYIERCKENLKSSRCWNCNDEIFNQERDGFVVYDKPINCGMCGVTTMLGKPYDVEAFLHKRREEREAAR